MKESTQSIKDFVLQLENDLDTACQNRSEPSRNLVLSLSGGLDSRVVAVGLKNISKKFHVELHPKYI